MSQEPVTVDEILKERKGQHGEFIEHAGYTQRLKEVLHSCPKWWSLHPIMREALEMNVHKIGRILAGDPFHADHWDDIQGYAKLVSDRIRDGRCS